MTLSIVKYPAKVLTRPARRITPKDKLDLRQIEADMFAAMREYDGVGLAAPQVGLAIRFITAHNAREGRTRSFVNPHITWMNDEEELGIEGCLSFPGVIGDVWRATAIRVKYQDLDFQTHEEQFEGYYARVLQHEIDHVNGVLLNERAEHGLRVPGEGEDEDEEDDEGYADGGDEDEDIGDDEEDIAELSEPPVDHREPAAMPQDHHQAGRY
jgi:peptide deformylase